MNYLILIAVCLFIVLPSDGIFLGYPTINQRAPFVVKLVYKNSSGEFDATGILVHPQFVLTSARRCDL